MARRTAATSNGDSGGEEIPETVPAYSMWCNACGENMQFDEIPGNRLLECPHCNETVIVPDTLGNEPVEEA